MTKYIEKIKILDNKLKEHHISEYAAQCAYYTIFAFIPFIILLFTLIQYTKIGEDGIFFIIQNLVPINMIEILEDIMQEVYFKSIGTLSFSIIFILWSASKGFFAISKGLHSVYEIKDKNNFIYFKMKSIACTILFIFSIIAVLIITVFGNTIMLALQEKVGIINILIKFLFKIRNILLFLTLFLTFALMYTFIPNHKVKLKSQLIGAGFASVSWYIISYFFSIYVNIFTNFSIVYGSLTTLMLLMMWVYFCMYFILLGAEINKMISEREKNKKGE